MATTANNKQIAAATATPTIPAKLKATVPGTGVGDGCGVELGDDEEVAGFEAEGKATSVGVEKGEVGNEVVGAEDETAGEVESIMDEVIEGATLEVELVGVENETVGEDESIMIEVIEDISGVDSEEGD